MIILYVETPYASFRKSYARSFAETYALPPPATVYGMLLSLVGEHFRKRHEGVRLAFAYKCRSKKDEVCNGNCFPRIATTLRKFSRYKYGVPNKQSSLGNAPDFIETLCNIEFLCWVDSIKEKVGEDGNAKGESLEQRILTALQNPQVVSRRSIVCLGLSDDAVNDISLRKTVKGKWHRLLPNDRGSLELPVWADHVRGVDTRWQRYELEKEPSEITSIPNEDFWQWTQIIDPRK